MKGFYEGVKVIFYYSIKIKLKFGFFDIRFFGNLPASSVITSAFLDGRLFPFLLTAKTQK